MKNNAKHTPGKWTIESVRMSGSGKHSFFRPCIVAGEKIIADLIWPGTGAIESDKMERKANARLIAAAPEMAEKIERLEAEKAELLAVLEGLARPGTLSNMPTNEQYAAAFAAIRKARGE